MIVEDGREMDGMAVWTARPWITLGFIKYL
jgi:hypothetical protein